GSARAAVRGRRSPVRRVDGSESRSLCRRGSRAPPDRPQRSQRSAPPPLLRRAARRGQPGPVGAAARLRAPARVAGPVWAPVCETAGRTATYLLGPWVAWTSMTLIESREARGDLHPQEPAVVLVR